MRDVWPQEPLQKVLADVIDYRGKAPPKSESGVQLITARNVRPGAIDLSHKEFIPEADFDAWMNRGLPTDGDILFTTEAPLGNVCMYPKNGKFAVGQRIVTLRSNRNLMDPNFLCCFLQSEEGQTRISFRSTGSTAKGIKSRELVKILVPVPPLPDQRKIAEILRTWDEAIEACERLRLKKIEQATWFRTDLFTGKVRLKGLSGAWRKRPLATVLTEHGLRSAGTEEVFSVSVHKGLVNQIEHLGRSFAAKETAHYNRVRPGDIVYTKSPTGDFPLGIIKQSKLDHDVVVSPLYGVFTPVTRDLGVILDAYFRSPATVRNYLAPLVQKGAKNTIAITNSRFLEGELNLPLDPKEHRAIAEIIEDADAEIAAIERQSVAYQAQRRGLMQKLLTGEWRVKSDA